MQLNRDNRIRQRTRRGIASFPSRQQSIDGREQEITMPKRRLKEPQSMKRGGFDIACQIQNEFYYFAPSEDRAAFFDAPACHQVHSR
jgi:hypothetical protein